VILIATLSLTVYFVFDVRLTGPRSFDTSTIWLGSGSKEYRNKKIPTIQMVKKTDVRLVVWNRTMAFPQLAIGPCFCCGEQIHILSFHLAHVEAKAQGGSDEFTNLRPTCAACNLGCAKQNLLEYRRKRFQSRILACLYCSEEATEGIFCLKHVNELKPKLAVQVEIDKFYASLKQKIDRPWWNPLGWFQ